MHRNVYCIEKTKVKDKLFTRKYLFSELHIKFEQLTG